MQTKRHWLLVQSGHQSTWLSCQSIVPNLSRAYETALLNLGLQFSYIDFDEQSLGETFFQIHLYKSKELGGFIFLDHHPFPEKVLKLIFNEFSSAREKPILWFHIFGDFTLYTDKWLELLPELSHFTCIWACASPAQKNLLTNFGIPSERIVVIPFPVNGDQFTAPASALLKQEARKKWNLRGKGPFFLYTGRISLQKNVIELMDLLAELKKQFVQLQLIIAGPFDDLSAPFFDIFTSKDAYKLAFFEKLNGLNKQFPQKWVHYLGSIPQIELASLYWAADLFVSLSLHHDEDFGMSVAEALMCDVPCLLSGWGGYLGFVDGVPDAVSTVQIEVDENGLYLEKEVFIRVAKEKLEQIGAHNETRKISFSKLAHQRYSISGVSDLIQTCLLRLNEMHPIPLTFSASGIEHAKRLKLLNPNMTIFPEGPTPSNSLYVSLYQAYFAQKQKASSFAREDKKEKIQFYKNWQAHPSRDQKMGPPHVKDLERFYHQFHWWTKALFNEQAVFFHEWLALKHNQQLNQTWIIRDGYIGLIRFFKSYPKPPFDLGKSKLLIHRSLKGIVPMAWRSHIEDTHHLMSNKIDLSSIKHLCVSATVNESMLPTNFSELIHKVLQKLPNLKTVYVFAPPAPSGYDKHYETFYAGWYMKFAQELSRHQLLTVKAQDIVALLETQTMALLELHNFSLVSYSYFQQKFQEKGLPVFSYPPHWLSLADSIENGDLLNKLLEIDKLFWSKQNEISLIEKVEASIKNDPLINPYYQSWIVQAIEQHFKLLC